MELKEDITTQALALLSSRFAIRIPPQVSSESDGSEEGMLMYSIYTQHHATSELISAHMGTCVGISGDGSVVQVDYPSEPILAEAAAYYFRKNLSIYAKCMDVLKHEFRLSLMNGMERVGWDLFQSGCYSLSLIESNRY